MMKTQTQTDSIDRATANGIATRLLGACEWRYDDTFEKWDTECGRGHILIEGTPADNHYSFCPYCGRVLEVSE
jgi:hypothetical protein